jgi:outer membrane lipoprotein carrier protein
VSSRRRDIAFLSALTAVTAFTAVPAHAQNADAIIGRSARVYRSLSSLGADFVQLINNPMIDSSESRGTLVQSGPSKLAMRFSDPPGEAVIIDGQHVWVYTPSTTPGQVLRIRVPSGGPVYGYNLLGWFLDKPAERYHATYVRPDRINGQDVDVIQLVPSVPDLPFERAVVWLAKGDALPRRLEISEHGDASRVLTLTHLRVNQSVSDKTFVFTIPQGVRVVDQ